jgi:hypothetical protein
VAPQRFQRKVISPFVACRILLAAPSLPRRQAPASIPRT